MQNYQVKMQASRELSSAEILPLAPMDQRRHGANDPLASLSRWTVVLPFYNEIGFLALTIASLIAQSVWGFDLILVDNGSNDGSALLALQLLAMCPRINTRLLFEPKPGHVHALRTGLAAVRTEFVATCDADTVYAPDYLARAQAVLDANPNAASVMAVYIDPAAPAWRAAKTRLHKRIAAMLFPRQCHTGGAGQTFRASALQAAGSYDADIWPYVIKDHELAHRVAKQGRVILDPQLWCTPSDRRSDRTSVDWTLSERIAYHLTPFAAKDWLFYRVLARRFARRAQTDLALREHPWTAPTGHGAVHTGFVKLHERTA
jgi:glycosyltransferase involved in cell wall biosynthesis